jgi:hypothetical protein
MNFPAQGYGQAPQQGHGGQPGYGQQAPQQGFGGQPQQPQVPQPITQSVDDYWAQNSGGGRGAPSYFFTPEAPAVRGTIVDMQARQRTEVGTGVPKFNKDGKPQMQLEVTLQTDLRGWQGVKPDKIPSQTNPQTGQSFPLPPEHDDGKRRVYVWYTLRDALQEAMQEAGVQQPKVGDMLAVQVVGTQPNPVGGNAIKVYKAWIQPGSPDAQAFFGQGQAVAPPAAPQQGFQPGPQTLAGQPNPMAQQAPPPQQPGQQFQNAAPAQQFQAAPPAQQQAWGTPPQQAAPPAPGPQDAGFGGQPQQAAAPQQQAPAGWGANATQDPPF